MKIFKLIIMTNVSEVKRSKLNQGNCKTPPISQQTQTVQTKISETRLLEASTNCWIMTYVVFMILYILILEAWLAERWGSVPSVRKVAGSIPPLAAIRRDLWQ